MQKILRTYSELIKINSFEKRYEYLRLQDNVGRTTFGFDRYLNQILYTSKKWLETRDKILIRDNGCDLGLDGFPILGKLIIHHMNPIHVEDIVSHENSIFDPEFLICTSHRTHLAIHYGDKRLLPQTPIKRRPGDTTPWFSKGDV